MNPAYCFGEKIAMRRGVKEMKKLYDAVESGTAPNPYRNLDQIATYAPKVLGDRAFAGMGGALGGGIEGVAYPVLSPHGASVLKLHDPDGLMATPDVLQAKRHFIGHNIPDVAKIYEELPAKGGVAAFLQEYIPGAEYERAHSEAALRGQGYELAEKAKALRERLRATTHDGQGLLDVGHHNMRVQPNGTVSLYDFIGAPADRLKPAADRPLGDGLAGHFTQGGNDPFMKKIVSRSVDALSSPPLAMPEQAPALMAKAFGRNAPTAGRTAPSGFGHVTEFVRKNPWHAAIGLGIGAYGAHKLYKRWQDKPADDAVAP